MQRLKLDKRLTGRRGWIRREELERELEALPDVSHKLAEPEGEAPSGEGGVDPGSRPTE